MSKPINLEIGYVTCDDLANWLKVSRRTLLRWTRLGKGPPSVKVGRSLYYRRASVEDWLASLELADGPGATVARRR